VSRTTSPRRDADRTRLSRAGDLATTAALLAALVVPVLLVFLAGATVVADGDGGVASAPVAGLRGPCGATLSSDPVGVGACAAVPAAAGPAPLRPACPRPRPVEPGEASPDAAGAPEAARLL
jgi:hypothetical protein